MKTCGVPHVESGRRCFLALLPDGPSQQALQRCRRTLENTLAGGAHRARWVDPVALHMTLRFFGTSSPAQIEHVARALPTLARPLPTIAARRLGVWPNRSRPRVLVLELEADDALSQLARACEALARNAGFAAEHRRFRAHITLARLRPGSALPALQASRPAMRFAAIALMQSTLKQSGATYTSLTRVAIPSAAK